MNIVRALPSRVRRYIYSIFALISVAIILLHPVNAKANVGDAIMSMTCETQGLGDLLTTEYAHTCAPTAISTVAIANIVSPLIYTNLMLKLKIGFDKLDYTNGQCTRQNRADNKNPTITFGICSNIQLFMYRLELIGQLITGSDATSIAEQLSGLSMDYSKFHDSFRNKEVGDNGIVIDLPTFALPWYVTQNNDRICVSTYTIFGSLLEVGCKYIKEPYPVGIYQEFFSTGLTTLATTDDNITNTAIPADAAKFFACSQAGGCAQTATEHSKALLSISSVIIECIRSTLLSTLISDTTCGITDGGIVYGSSMFHGFQQNMQRAVMAFLTIYVIFVGFKLILAQGDVPPAGEFIMYAIKLILVIYFSVGININGQGSVDGMTQWIFPLLLEMANEMASWVANAAPSGLCSFPNSDYTSGFSRLALWDILDCKVMNYLGFDALSSLFLGSSAGDNLGHSVPPYIFLLIPALISGQINLVMLALAYPLVVMSVAAYLVTTFAVCLIAITVLAVLAPIYVPFALFEQTKGYFESWWKMMFSFTLQPVVIVGFMTVMFAIFDQGFYTDCEFTNISVERVVNGGIISKKLFVVQTDKIKYSDYSAPNSEKYNNCTSSLGWILNKPLSDVANAAMAITASGDGAQVIKVPPPALNYADYQSSYPAVNAIKEVSGVFTSYTSLIGSINKQMIINLFACMLMLYLMRELSGQMSEFAADISGGVSLKGTTISPRSMTGDKIRAKLEEHKDNKNNKESDKRDSGNKSSEDSAKTKGGGDSKDGKDSSGGALRSSASSSPQKSAGHHPGESEV